MRPSASAWPLRAATARASIELSRPSRRALDMHGPPVYVRKEIVHNKHVVQQLSERGAIFVEEETEVPEGELVVFSAHGVSPAVHENAAARQLRTIDATCPLVTKVHVSARKFADQGYTIIMIGHAGHEEVEGTMGEAPEAITLVETIEDADTVDVPDPDHVAFITQTTLSVDETAEIIDRLRERFPKIVSSKSEDICYATTNRQIAVKQLATRVRPGARDRLDQLIELEPPRRGRPRPRRRLASDRQRLAGPRGVARGSRDARHHVRRVGARGARRRSSSSSSASAAPTTSRSSGRSTSPSGSCCRRRSASRSPPGGSRSTKRPQALRAPPFAACDRKRSLSGRWRSHADVAGFGLEAR